MTVQAVYNDITNYNTTQELSEAQIAAIYENIGGAVGRLAEACGVTTYNIPYTYLTRALQNISNISLTKLSWDTEQADNLGMYDSENPEYFKTPTAGLYLISYFGKFASNATGKRTVMLYRGGTQHFVEIKPAVNGTFTYMWLTGIYYIPKDESCYIQMQQDSGGVLSLSYNSLVVRRIAVM